MRDETRELIAHALSGDLSPEESERLLAMCRADEEIRAELGRLAVADRLLRSAYSETTAEIVAREVTLRLQPETSATDLLVARVARKNWWTIFGPRLAWAAGILVLLASGGWYGMSLRTVATLARCEATRWTGKQRTSGDSLRAGQRMTFSSGLIEVDFDGGAVVVVEGPADMEIRDRASAFLHRGRAVARVPEQARGFIIDSPRGRLVDLGTEFGVAVGETGETEVHVIEGRVDATLPGRAKPVELRANEALRLVSTGPTWMKADENAFVTEMPPRAEEKPGFIHWSFDEGSGNVARNIGQGLGDEDAHLVFRDVRPNSNGPAWIQGPFGSALEFDGKGAFAECGYRGISGRQARSITAWVRVPKDFKTTEGYGIVGWGIPSPPGSAWQLSANPVALEGAVGRLRIGAGSGSVVGTTDLRDGRWHHVAAVMYGGARANTATHVLIYVDGKLDPASRKSLREIVTDTESPNHGLWVGRNVASAASWKSNFSPGGPFFRGAVDEVFVISAALSEEQIVQIMRENRL
jgi:hypothetical protein